MDDQNRILAGLILNCKPEDLKGIAQKADGSLAVVAPNGMKFIFSPVELDNARDSFCLPVIPLAEPVEASERTEHTPPTPHTSMPARQKSPHGTGASSVSGLSSAVENPMASTGSAIGHARTATSESSVSGVGAHRHRKEAHA